MTSGRMPLANRPLQLAALGVVALGVTLAVLAAALLILHPSLDRMLLAALILADLGVIAAAASLPAGIVVAVGFLMMLGLLRRLLIPVSGWNSYDLLLIVVPAFSLGIAYRMFVVERRPVAADALSRLVAATVALGVLQVLNPLGGGIVPGLTGLLFVAAPLLWFFVGRELIDERLAGRLLGFVLVMTVGVALYGLVQTLVAMPPWDAAWVSINGYTALSVGGLIRAFGTLTSSGEYGALLTVGLVVAVAALLRGRVAAVAALAVLPLAIILESGRTEVVLFAVALVVMLGLRTGRARWLLLTIAVGAAVAVGGQRLAGESLARSSGSSGNPLVTHEVQGLADPLNPDRSTLLLHGALVVEGLQQALHTPLGEGTAATNRAGAKLGDIQAGTEVDVSNAFVSLGILGAVYPVVVVLVLVRSMRLALLRPDFSNLAIAGILVVTLGQWANGGYYTLAPLVWMVIGSSNARWLATRAVSPPEPRSRRPGAGRHVGHLRDDHRRAGSPSERR